MGIFADNKTVCNNPLSRLLDPGIGIQGYLYFIANSIYFNVHRQPGFYVQNLLSGKLSWLRK